MIYNQEQSFLISLNMFNVDFVKFSLAMARHNVTEKIGKDGIKQQIIVLII